MNSRTENKSSAEMSIEDLVQMNGDTMAVMDEVPYQPMVYAVPKEWLESWMQLLANATKFQPTLYGKIALLATQEELMKQQVSLKADVEVTKREMLKSFESLKKQDGNLKEEYFSKLSEKHSGAVKAIQEEYAKQQKENLRFMIVTIASSAVLSALVCGLFLLLGG